MALIFPWIRAGDLSPKPSFGRDTVVGARRGAVSREGPKALGILHPVPLTLTTAALLRGDFFKHPLHSSKYVTLITLVVGFPLDGRSTFPIPSLFPFTSQFLVLLPGVELSVSGWP